MLGQHVTHSICNGVLFVDPVESFWGEVDVRDRLLLKFAIDDRLVGLQDFFSERLLVNSAPNQLAVANNDVALLSKRVSDLRNGEPQNAGGVVEAPINTDPTRLPILKLNIFAFTLVAFKVPVGEELSGEHVPASFQPSGAEVGRQRAEAVDVVGV